jgi:hypothetical protein
MEVKGVKSTLDVNIWREHNQGYLFGSELRECKEYQIALEYIKSQAYYDKEKFNHGLDCYYLENNCHIEQRGSHCYLRPSYTAKFILEDSLDIFDNYELLYAYHGTNPNNIGSIL